MGDAPQEQQEREYQHGVAQEHRQLHAAAKNAIAEGVKQPVKTQSEPRQRPGERVGTVTALGFQRVTHMTRQDQETFHQAGDDNSDHSQRDRNDDTREPAAD